MPRTYMHVELNSNIWSHCIKKWYIYVAWLDFVAQKWMWRVTVRCHVTIIDEVQNFQ